MTDEALFLEATKALVRESAAHEATRSRLTEIERQLEAILDGIITHDSYSLDHSWRSIEPGGMTVALHESQEAARKHVVETYRAALARRSGTSAVRLSLP